MLAAGGLLVAGLLLLTLQQPAGAGVVLAALVLLAIAEPQLMVIVAVGVLPITTVGWHAEVMEINSRILDARLVLTFGVATLFAGMAVVLAIRGARPSRLEIAMLGFVLYAALLASARGESAFAWMPYVARWTAFFGAFALAKRLIATPERYRQLMLSAMIGFAIPSAWGILQLLTGGARLMNGAFRAEALGASGPIALAFAGLFVLLAAFLTLGPGVPGRVRRAGLLLSVLGGAAIIASATRVVTATAWAGLAVPLAVAGRWRRVAMVTIIIAGALLARPDFAGRFVDAIVAGLGGDQPHPGASAPPDGSSNGSGAEPEDPEVIMDASMRFRFFVWRTLLDEWVQQPLLGTGPGGTAAAVERASGVKRVPPHNDYIGVLGELGVVGLGIFLGIQAGVVVALARSRRFAVAMAVRGLGNPRVTAVVIFVCFNVLGALNNPMYFLDVQVAVWAVVGAALAVWPGAARELVSAGTEARLQSH
ncbi:MAG: O-antigen ligase family protein [Chloroflexota bacterium]